MPNMVCHIKHFIKEMKDHFCARKHSEWTHYEVADTQYTSVKRLQVDMCVYVCWRRGVRGVIRLNIAMVTDCFSPWGKTMLLRMNIATDKRTDKSQWKDNDMRINIALGSENCQRIDNNNENNQGKWHLWWHSMWKMWNLLHMHSHRCTDKYW